jgi:UDP-glucose 4-epimerase
MRALVTGGAGFIGSNLVNRLIKDGHDVVIVDDLSTGERDNIHPKAEAWIVDISDVHEYWDEIFDNIDVVFHTAARARVQPSIKNPIKFNDVNVTGTLNMLKCCVDYGVKRFVYSSSSSVYGNVEKLPTPENHELNPMSDGMNLEGAYKLVIPIFTEQRLNGKPMTIRGDGEQRRDFTYVGDVVDANIRCAASLIKWAGEVINIGNGDNRSVNDLADMIGGDRVNVEPVIEPRQTLADNYRAGNLLDWKPTMKIEDWIKTYKERMGI